MPFGVLDESQKVTADRKTHVIFDESWPGVGHPPYALQRSGPQIHPIDTTDLDLLKAGGWTLKPLQHITSAVVEQTDPTGSHIGASRLSVGGHLTEKPIWHAPTDLPGATTGASPVMANIGGLVLQRQVPAGASWIANEHAADVASFPQVPLSSVIPSDRLVVGNDTFDPNTGFLVRFYVPATRLHAPDILHTYYFGGPNLPSGGGQPGTGQYALSVSGDGIASLNMYLTDAAGTPHWYRVAEWRYADPSNAGGSYYNISIRPYYTGTGSNPGQGIEFRSALGDQVTQSGGLVNAYLQAPSDPRTYNFWLAQALEAQSAIWNQTQKRAFKDWQKGATTATGAGNIRLDSRRDHRGAIQFSTLTYPASASLHDRNFVVEFFPDPSEPLTLSWSSTLPAAPGAVSDCSIIGTLYNADDGTPLTLVTDSLTANSAQFTPVKTASGYYAVFDLTASLDQTRAPILWNYRVVQDGTIVQDSSVEWGGYPWSGGTLSITGPEADPSHSAAVFQIQDPTNTMPLLRERGEIPCRIETEYDPDDSTKRSVLFRGFTDQVVGTKLGSGMTQGLDPASPARLNPSSEWRHYNVQASGMWTRLETALLPHLVNLVASDGTPMKVTDAVRAAFGWAGFPDSMIDVPDAPVQFWPTAGTQQQLILNPASVISDFIFKSVRDYLGWYMIWDDNAGAILASGAAQGMWRVIQPPIPPYTPLAAFTEVPPTGNKSVTYPGSYPSSPPTTFIPQGCWSEYVKKPEGNAVYVLGSANATAAVAQWWVNTNSYTFDPAKPADRNNPDYLGYIKRIIVTDAAIAGQASVDWICQRVFDIACHAIKMATIKNCPMLLVTDPNDTKQSRPRPLRYYDPVNITVSGVTAPYLVRNFNPEYMVDSIQYGTLELQAPVNDSQMTGANWVSWG